MKTDVPFFDIHSHFLPGIDDGSNSWDESIEMAKLAYADGTRDIVVTPHQLGSYPENDGDTIRPLVSEFQRILHEYDIEIRVWPGGDVRIEDGLVNGIRTGQVLTLTDQKKYVLLELPHELYLPLSPVLAELHRIGVTGILSHPERNQGLLSRPNILEQLVDEGCLMQVTAASINGTFGPHSQNLSMNMLTNGLVHFVASDAHGCRARRPLLRRAFETVVKTCSSEYAVEIFSENGIRIGRNEAIRSGRRTARKRTNKGWFSWSKSA